ncbi:hypothetical protein BUZ14_09920 [Staphylococcus gallinarum]|uniref:SdpI family protein n=1 Tax=Staphylococcus gallinarum TaxID=1293 RepID=A0A3A0VKL2_STAGA|nr:hypothetical protein BUZ14_09920 [Staphylococcus gallinarum]
MLLLTLMVVHYLIIQLFKRNVERNLADKPNLFMGYRSFNSLNREGDWQYAQQMFLKYAEQVNKLGIVIAMLWLIWDTITWLMPNSLIIQAIIFFIGMIYIIVRTEICITKS